MLAFFCLMAKIHPQVLQLAADGLGSDSRSSTRETFTIWLKSLVFHGNGFTVYDSNGKVTHRIDNYSKKCKNGGDVFLMDLHGHVLFTIRRKKFSLFRQWNGQKCNMDSSIKDQKPWFQVKKHYCLMKYFFQTSSTCRVTMGNYNTVHYEMSRLGRKPECRITDKQGRVVAEMTQKQSSGGALIDNDVLSLVVEPHVDRSFVMALVAVYGLINHRM